MMSDLNTTIAAISTPRGKGGIAVIRISGGDALEIASRVFLPKNDKKIADSSLESVNARIVAKTTKIAVLTLKYNENEVISDTFALHAELEIGRALPISSI